MWCSPVSFELQKQRLSELLREYRAQHNLTGRALAKRLGLNPTSLLNYVDQTAYPSTTTREKIAQVVGMTPLELEAYLNNFQVKPLRPVEQIKQDIRALGRDDFLEIAPVVLHRLLLEAGKDLPELK